MNKDKKTDHQITGLGKKKSTYGNKTQINENY
jgi:hypothetical protein